MANFRTDTSDAVRESLNSLMEGVETEQQADAISIIGIELCQGNYYAYPQPIEFYKK